MHCAFTTPLLKVWLVLVITLFIYQQDHSSRVPACINCIFTSDTQEDAPDLQLALPTFSRMPCRSALAHMDTAAPKLHQLQPILSPNMMEQEEETAKSGCYIWIHQHPRHGCKWSRTFSVPYFPLAIGRI